MDDSRQTPGARPLPICFTVIALLGSFAGCNDSPDGADSAAGQCTACTGQVAQGHVEGQLAVNTPPPAPSAPLPIAENESTRWDVLYLQGTKAGYGATTITSVTEGGRNLSRIENVLQMAVQRGDEQTSSLLRTISMETPVGELVQFEAHTEVGPRPMVTRGSVQNGKLLLVEGNSIAQRDFPPGTGGFQAVEQSLRRQPMKPGEQRRISALLQGINQVGQVELQAQVVESTKLLDASRELLRIEAVTVLGPQNNMRSVLWADAAGEVLKTYHSAFNMESYRTTKELALSNEKGPKYDLLRDTVVKLSPPLSQGHDATEAKYLIRLQRDNPAQQFASGLFQHVKPVDAHTAEVTVRAARLGLGHHPDSPADVPGSDDREPNSFVQSNDPLIEQLATQISGNEADALRAALRLEAFVHQSINKKNFSQALASASDVAKSREGDCTEHSVLLAALARARGMPARVAIGLVYLPAQSGFGYHMWNEVWIDERWIPLDATLGRGGIGAAHLKLSHSTLKGASSYESFLPVAQVMGQLEIQVVESK